MLKKYKIYFLLFLVIFFINTFPSKVLGETVRENSNYKENQILVRFRRALTDSDLKSFIEKYNLVYQPENKPDNKNDYFLFETAAAESILDKIKLVKKDIWVKNAQPNFIFQAAQKTTLAKKKSSQDKLFNREWWVYNDGKFGTAGADIYLMSVWSQEQENWPAIVIGVIDTGVNKKHDDLKKNIIQGYDFIRNRKTKMTDKDGHGSFIAGLIASEVNNRKGIAGLSQLNRLKIMPLKFDFSTEEAVSAITMAQAKGVRILNASWGTNEYDQALYDAIKSYNGLIITAAGNEREEHTDENNNFYPCDFDLDNVICVGASGENDQLASYSDWSSKNIDILAPGGEDLPGEEMPMISLDSKTNRYVEEVGTSFSTALVSGTAGLVLSANPTISNLEIKNLILNNARKKENLTDKVVSGGVLNVKAAVNKENIANINQ